MDCFSEDQLRKPRKRQMSRAKRVLANRRERERVRKMNDAFEELRSTIPNQEETRVKTKLELLRIATNYIQSLKNSIKKSSSMHDSFSSPMNALMYPMPFENENIELSKSSSRVADHSYPPQFVAPPPPLPPGFTELTSFQYGPHQPAALGPQFPASMTASAESSSADFCSLLSASLVDSHSAENLLYNLQVKKSLWSVVS